MTSLLVIIGALSILMLISKALKKFGNFCDFVAEALTDVPQKRNICYKIKHPKKKTDTFDEQIQKEIEELTGE
jgi:hypothetical protein